MAVSCPACDDQGPHAPLDAREMMLGLRDPFRYLQCRACGALWLPEPPRDLGRFYPAGYYSFNSSHDATPARSSRAARLATRAALRTPPAVVDAAALFRGVPPWLRALSGLGIRPSSRICDVGSGRGDLLRRLERLGFEDLTGVDPYLPQDTTPSRRIRLLARDIEALDEDFDLYLLNHSFEHMPDGVRVLRHLRRHLRPGGAIVVRVPVADSHAFRKYGAAWVGLDPPRHLLVPTKRAMAVLAQRAGLAVERTFHDSFELQFWGSELYERGLPLQNPRAAVEGGRPMFSPRELRRWARRSRWLNLRKLGDSAGFVLRPASPSDSAD